MGLAIQDSKKTTPLESNNSEKDLAEVGFFSIQKEESISNIFNGIKKALEEKDLKPLIKKFKLENLDITNQNIQIQFWKVICLKLIQVMKVLFRFPLDEDFDVAEQLVFDICNKTINEEKIKFEIIKFLLENKFYRFGAKIANTVKDSALKIKIIFLFSNCGYGSYVTDIAKSCDLCDEDKYTFLMNCLNFSTYECDIDLYESFTNEVYKHQICLFFLNKNNYFMFIPYAREIKSDEPKAHLIQLLVGKEKFEIAHNLVLQLDDKTTLDDDTKLKIFKYMIKPKNHSCARACSIAYAFSSDELKLYACKKLCAYEQTCENAGYIGVNRTREAAYLARTMKSVDMKLKTFTFFLTVESHLGFMLAESIEDEVLRKKLFAE